MMQFCINEDRATAAGLRDEVSRAGKTVDKLAETEERIRHYLEISTPSSDIQSFRLDEVEVRMAIQASKMEAFEQQIAAEAAKLQQRMEYCARLEAQVTNLQQARGELEGEVTQLNQRLEEAEAKAVDLEHKQRETERLRAEQEGKSFWQVRFVCVSSKELQITCYQSVDLYAVLSIGG